MKIYFEKLLKKFFPQKGFARNVLVLASGTAVAQGLLVLVSPLLTRLYTPDDFGVIATYVSVLSIMVVMASFRYELAIPLPKDGLTAANLLALSLLILTLMSLFSGFILWILGDKLVHLLNVTKIKSYFWLLPLSLFGAGGYKALNYWGIRKKAFIRITRTKLSQSIGQTITQIVLGLAHFGSLGLLIGDVVGRLGGWGTLASLAWRQDKADIKGVSRRGIVQAAHRYWRFSLLSSGSALIYSAGLQLPPLLIVALFGTQVAGWFALSQRVLGVPLDLLGASVLQVYLAEAANKVTVSPDEIQLLYWKTVKNMFFIGLPFVCIIVLTAPWLFKIVFGPKWINAGIYLQVLSFMYFFRFVSGTVGVTLDVLERQDLNLFKETIRIFLVAGALFLAVNLHLKPIAAITILSIASSIYYVGTVFIGWYALKVMSSKFTREQGEK